MYENRDILNAFITHKVDLRFLLEQSLREYYSYEYNKAENKDFHKQRAIELVFFLLDNKADINVVKNRDDILLYKSFTPELLYSFLEKKMNPTIPMTDNPKEHRIFPYQLAVGQDRQKVLAYAIPLYVKDYHMSGWKTLLLCLHAKKKTSCAFNTPRYLNTLLCGAIAVQINKIIKKLKNVNLQFNQSNEVISLRNSMCKLINMHNKAIHNW